MLLNWMKTTSIWPESCFRSQLCETSGLKVVFSFSWQRSLGLRIDGVFGHASRSRISSETGIFCLNIGANFLDAH